MVRKLVTAICITLLAFPMVQGYPVIKTSEVEKEVRLAQRVKSGINKLGIGQEAQVKIKLKDKTKLAGYISEVGPDSFVIMNAATGAPITVGFPSVAQVQGNNLSTRTKIIITASVIAGIIIVLYIVMEQRI